MNNSATVIKDTTYKGTRILLGNKKRNELNRIIQFIEYEGFQEISIPIIQYADMFKDKVGEENNNLMFQFRDRKDRELCLAPEYTSIVQELAKTTFKQQKNVMLFYVQECFRGEKPQAGRYRQFTQLGVEILNPDEDFSDYLVGIARKIVHIFGVYDFIVKRNVVRGLDYYKQNTGFEIIYDNGKESGTQICGGGAYENGIGFAIGIERLLDI